MSITDRQSYTWVLREQFIQVLAALPFFASYTVKRNRRLPIQTADLPVLGVYIMDETMMPDGDANAGGPIRFIHTFRLGFSAVIVNNDDAQSEQILDAAFWAMMGGLWANESVTNRLNTATWHNQGGTPDNVRFESVTRGVRRHHWGSSGLNNETDTAEVQYEASICYRADYPVPITDTLDEINVKTNFPSDHSGDPADVPQVEVEYDFTTQQKQGVTNGRHPASDSANGAAPRNAAEGRPQGSPRGYQEKQ